MLGHFTLLACIQVIFQMIIMLSSGGVPCCNGKRAGL